MKKKLIILFAFYALKASTPLYTALITQPVADLYLETGSGNPNHQDFFAPDSSERACLRIHQIRFNEQIDVLSDPHEGKVCCALKTPLFLSGNKAQKKFWVDVKNFVPLTKIAAPHIPTIDKDLLKLVLPWYCKKLATGFSVGTRFVRCPRYDSDNAYAIYILSAQGDKEHIVRMPKNAALVDSPTNPTDQRALFLSILKRWTRPKRAFIPYVYGGCSFSTWYDAREIQLKRTRKFSYWTRVGAHPQPLSGFDCSGLILCAAQLSGINYAYKNTKAITEFMQPIKKGAALKAGDLIWYHKHVLVISDLEKKLVTEAIGYESGYGKVHEIPLWKVFKGITSFETLSHIYQHKMPVKRLNCKNIPYKKLSHIKLFSLIT